MPTMMKMRERRYALLTAVVILTPFQQRKGQLNRHTRYCTAVYRQHLFVACFSPGKAVNTVLFPSLVSLLLLWSAVMGTARDPG